ncbi:universal stress protein [Halomicrobium sp. LC1Hm]|uniref:universal stress protein n=1 Tax=Halomicrobium sp. LC1Hm TaxID=2610902 RepID=UPI00129835EE|nr:universal stress protein [Halomicrobium sp. LC1Hm]QGA84448.1 Nucleotide-binding protein, UspA family [Halomicrobium sp. LC1Hm]
MSPAIDSILVPTDGSEGATVGAQRGIDLAATADADVHVLSVVDTREIEPSLSRFGGKDRSDREQLFEDEARRAVDSVTGLAQTHLSGRVTGTVERGVPFQAINEYVEGHDIDVIAMGTHGRTGLQRLLLGSVAEKVLRTANVPVVAVPSTVDEIEPGEGTYENVLLPTDNSDGASVAIDWGMTLATLYGAMVYTIYSVDTSLLAGSERASEIHGALEQVGRDALDAVRRRARATGVSVAGNVGSGPAARVILAESGDHDIDLIVMGTHGRSGIDRYLIGSVTETVVRNADVPVCCVPMTEL